LRNDPIPAIPVPPTSVAAFTLPAVFTLNPSNFGGRKARRGFAFQDLFIAYVLAGFAAGLEDLIAARVEGVEDLDVLIRKESSFVERYIQIKSREEGQGAWTINQLVREGVLSRFLDLYLGFKSLNQNPDIGIELVLVVEGDLNAELLQIAGKVPGTDTLKPELFIRLAAERFIATNPSFRSRHNHVSDYYRAAVESFLKKDSVAVQTILERMALPRVLASESGIAVDAVTTSVMESGRLVAELLDEFISCVSFVSRTNVFATSAEPSTLGTDAKDLIRLRLLESGDVTSEEAGKAVERLLREIADESMKPEATPIDRTVLESWLKIPKRTVFESKPVHPPEFVERAVLLPDLVLKLSQWRLVNVYGLPKVGKSFVISSLVDRLKKQSSYFWFTFAAEPGEVLRLLGQLAEFGAMRGGSWQIVEDIAMGKLQPAQIISRLAQNSPSGGSSHSSRRLPKLPGQKCIS
jgi:hypothetical protein